MIWFAIALTHRIHFFFSCSGNNSPEWIEREIQDIGMVSWDMKNYTHEELQNITLRMKIRVVNALTEYESDEYSFFLPDISKSDFFLSFIFFFSMSDVNMFSQFSGSIWQGWVSLVCQH